MKIDGKEELLKLLYALQENCGDIRGRDGEYLSEQVGKAIDEAENLDAIWEDQ